MIDQNRTWIDKTNEVIRICAEANLPITPEIDSNPHGIDGVLEFGNIDFDKSGDVFDVDFIIILRYTVPRAKWAELIAKLGILSQKLCRDQRLIFEGWTRIKDESNLIYEGNVTVRGMVNADLLS